MTFQHELEQLGMSIEAVYSARRIGRRRWWLTSKRPDWMLEYLSLTGLSTAPDMIRALCKMAIRASDYGTDPAASAALEASRRYAAAPSGKTKAAALAAHHTVCKLWQTKYEGGRARTRGSHACEAAANVAAAAASTPYGIGASTYGLFVASAVAMSGGRNEREIAREWAAMADIVRPLLARP
jgi:hypothetical protein